MEFNEESEAARARQQKISSLEGMIKKGKPPQAEKAKKALFKLQREMEDERKRKKEK